MNSTGYWVTVMFGIMVRTSATVNKENNGNWLRVAVTVRMICKLKDISRETLVQKEW